MTDEKRRFYTLSAEAIREGILTKEERDAISRVGTRKETYWCRHLYDLKCILEDRLAQRKEGISDD